MDSPFPPSAPPAEVGLSIKAWNLLGGQIDWAGLPVVVEILGVKDPELLVLDLITIREHLTEKD